MMYNYDEVKPEKISKSKGGKGGLLPWLIGAGVALGGWLLYEKKKQAEVEVATRQREQDLLRQHQEAEKASEVPKSSLNSPLEGTFSASERLKGMGIDPSKPAHYQQRGDPYAG